MSAARSDVVTRTAAAPSPVGASSKRLTGSAVIGALTKASGRSDLPPIVIVSSRAEKEFTERARQLGAANYLIKPLVDEELDAALHQLAPLSHLVRDVTLFESEKLS